MFSTRRFTGVVLLVGSLSIAAGSAEAATLRVPQDHQTIQAAIDAAAAGDTVLVSGGTYTERIRLKPGVILKSAGDDAPGKLGLKRAEATVLDGGDKAGKGPGVVMAEEATLDGFTVTGVGLYDDEEWNKHHATQGEELPLEQGAVGTGSGFPAVGVPGVDCTLRYNIVHHNGHAGIGIRGAKDRRVAPHVWRNVVYRNMGGGIGSADGSTARIEANTCFQNLRGGIGNRAGAYPLVIDNVCYENIRAGIGNREGSYAILRGNKCYRNRRAGIGIRMEGTSPLVEDNECYENDMAGIGNRDAATPIIRGNRCYKNKMAGIGSRDGARAVIEGNECFENEMAGIGSRLGAMPVIRNNRCYKNKMAGIGSREKASPVIEDNECFENEMAGIGSRTGATPVIRNNRCYKNVMAGIGSREQASPVIVGNTCYQNVMAGIGSREEATPIIVRNVCYENQAAGIGSRDAAEALIVGNESRRNKLAGIGAQNKAVVTILGNKCLENGMVAIGLREGARAHIAENELVRTGGMPPMIAVREESRAIIRGNVIRGGGVAGVIVQGSATIAGNQFLGNGPRGGPGPPNFAVWLWGESDVRFSDNRVDRWRHALHASGAKHVSAGRNTVSRFLGTAIVVQKTLEPADVFGNVALSNNSQDKAVAVSAAEGVVAENVVKPLPKPEEKPADRAVPQ